MCCFLQDFIWKRVKIFRLIKTDTLFQKYWKAPIVIKCYIKYGHMPNTLGEVMIPFFSNSLRSLRENRRWVFCRPCDSIQQAQVPVTSKEESIPDTSSALFCLHIGEFLDFIWHVWLPLWQMKKCNVIIFMNSYWIARISRAVETYYLHN